jgi:hypothetical protein
MDKLPNSNSESGNDTNVRLTEERPPGMPRWVKVSGIIAIALALLFISMHLFGGGGMGPMHHMKGMKM